MRPRVLTPLAVVCFGIVALVAHLAAQNAAAISQVAFLKASNPGAYHHFGEGGVLPSPYQERVGILEQ